VIFCKYKIEKGSTENFLYRAFLDFNYLTSATATDEAPLAVNVT